MKGEEIKMIKFKILKEIDNKKIFECEIPEFLFREISGKIILRDNMINKIRIERR